VWDDGRDDADYQGALKRQQAWVSDEEIRELTNARITSQVVTGRVESPVDQAKRMMREAAPMAAQSLIRLAQNSDNDSVRLRASTEILNRAEGAGTVDGKEPWAEFFEDASNEAAEIAKRAAS
jgi:hypothetical protein